MKIYTELIDLSNDIRQTFFVSPFSDYKMGVKVVQDVGFKVMDGDVELSPEAELIDGYTIYSLKSTTPGRKTYMVVCENGQSVPIVEVTQKSTVYDVGSVKKTSEIENDSGFIGGDEAQEIRNGIDQATETANTAQSNVDSLQTNVQQNRTDIDALISETEIIRSENEQMFNEVSTMLDGKADISYVDNEIGNVLMLETF